ncbi:C2H2 type zinc finger domain-containing protein [Caldisphaera sp.]|uniref:C2H2 type zinc finger domain-containing protein n=1 Tax=Caldisphaera sp. TaxID=2060322 RepID=UPI0025C39D56|nr:C2H2 type zinc finger domain-containing protein [Caldisphaera sp.]
MPICPVCRFEADSWLDISDHIEKIANEKSDPQHVMWLNRNVSQKEIKKEELEAWLYNYFEKPESLSTWIRRRFIEKFYSDKPHPFMLAMQKPTRGILLGYVLEHRHFLQNWVKVLSLIVFNTDKEDVIKYELENISTEYLGINGKPSHYELLIRMGESLGLSRQIIFSTDPLPLTKESIETWRHIALNRPWIETMAAMHSLEIAADRSNKNYGAKIHYFNTEILSSDKYSKEVKDFLREGYEADVGHAAEALNLIEKYADTRKSVENIKVTVLKSLEALDKYLFARLERAMQFEPEIIEVIRQ